MSLTCDGAACASDIENVLSQDDCSHTEVENSDDRPAPTHRGDCDGSLHHLGCCNPIILGTVQRTLPDIEVASAGYSDQYLILKPDPSLDGPFQPPRS